MPRIPLFPVRRTGGSSPPPTPPRPDAIDARSLSVDAIQLSADLARALRGEVRFSVGDRALYSTDASNYRQIPIGVVLPRDAEDVEAAVAICRRVGAPIVARGGATDLAGATCNAAVVLDFSKYMNRVLDIDWNGRVARVQPGTVLDDLRSAAEDRHLTFGPDPATHNRNTLGGMIGNNSCGMHAQMAGKVEENTVALEVLTYDGERMWVGETPEPELARIIAGGGRRGEIYAKLRDIRDRYANAIRARFPKIPRLVSGYPLHQLLPEHGFNVARALVGTENTCVTVLEARLRLVHSPPARTLVVFGFADIVTAAEHVAFCNTHCPIALEGIDSSMFTYMHDKGMSTSGRAMFPDGGAWLVVEFGGETRAESDARADSLIAAFSKCSPHPSAKRFDDPAQEHLLWQIRESGLGATSKIPHDPNFYPGWEDSAVGPEDVGDYLRDLQKLLAEYGYTASLYGHFGQGCVHCSIDFDLYTQSGIDRWKRFLNEAAHLVTSYGGSLSGEHGDGQARGALLPIMFGDELVQAFREFKSVWDPTGKMNPGKVIDAYPVDENLRWGTHYHPWDPPTHFAFPDDGGSFAYAANRCVGTGKCRKHDGGTMCPSYMATRDEKHSTRGRARLLFEMLEGNPLRNGWRDEAVKDALDLCLACKGCRSECPVNVDMATYKSEFLSHYYDGHRRPMSAYAFGLMYWWSRAASHLPRVANFVTHAPGIRDVLKRAAGIAPQRHVPRFAAHTFRHWFEHRPLRKTESPRVLLWPDTWNNYFHPDALHSAVKLLKSAGKHVQIPRRHICCGRPLYDFGFLDEARRYLRRILAEFAPQIDSGIPVVMLEPSCATVFRDELTNFFPKDERAIRLGKQTVMLGEMLAISDWQPPQMPERHIVVHGHCHQKTQMTMKDDMKLLQATGASVELLDSGCCGMAGPFGFEHDKYEVSQTLANRVLLPAVRNAGPNDLIVSNGFSCREQIHQNSSRKALHLAQVLAGDF